MKEDDVVVAYRARDANEATMIVQALEAAGVEAMAAGGASGGAAFGDLGADAFLVDVLVRQDVAEAARKVILDWQARWTEDTPWVCPACSESNESGFDLCWKCRTRRP